MANRFLFKVKARYIPTNRVRSNVEIWARSESELSEKLNSLGYEPAINTTIVANPPSEAQINYAKSLGINILPEMDKMDLSALISRKVEFDSYSPNQGLMDFADNHDIIFSNYIGKKALYNLIFEQLTDLDKAAFFVFSVYRYLSDNRESNLDISPVRDICYNCATQIVNDKKLQTSLNRYSGENIRFFGTLHVNGNIYEGGSVKTQVYQYVKDYLINNGVIHNNTANTKYINREPVETYNTPSNFVNKPIENVQSYQNEEIVTTNSDVKKEEKHEHSILEKFAGAAIWLLILYWIFG